MQRRGVQHELAAFGFCHRGGDRHFAAELIGRPSFAFADALDLGGMQRINLGTALAVILKAHPHRQGEKMGKALPQRLVVADLAADIADHPTEPNAQELEFSPRSIELVAMGIAADHDRGALGHPTIALPQSHSSALGEIDQLLQRAMDSRASVGCAIAFGCTVVSTTTRSRSRVAKAPVLCATDKLSWSKATNCSSPSRWRQCVSEERSNGSW